MIVTYSGETLKAQTRRCDQSTQLVRGRRNKARFQILVGPFNHLGIRQPRVRWIGVGPLAAPRPPTPPPHPTFRLSDTGKTKLAL